MNRTFGFLAVLAVVFVSCSPSPVKEVEVPLSLRYDPGYYLRSTGGKTKNGCEAWATSLKTGEYLYVGKCDAPRLGELGFNIREALEFNQALPLKQRIIESGTHYMIDYTGLKQQALFGHTSNRCLAQVVLNEKKEFIFFRLDGDLSRMTDCGIPLQSLLEQNGTLPEDYKIIPDLKGFSYIEDVKNNRRFLIGKNSRSQKTVAWFDGKGKILGYKNLDR